jgi:hypothetical protein
MTDLKAATSRENGARSTGPVTPEGRERSSRNATKLGIFSQRRFLQEEDPAEFAALFEQLIVEFQAEGILETAFVHDIATNLWRRRRLDRAEVASIEQERAAFTYGLAEQKWSELSPNVFVRLERLAPEDRELLQKYRDELAIAGRSLPKDDQKFHRIEVSLARALERAVRGLREVQAHRRASNEPVLVNPRASSTSRRQQASDNEALDAVVVAPRGAG